MSWTLNYEGTARTLATDAGVLRYHEAGHGPPLVFLHGPGPGVTGWRLFRDTLPAFAEFFRCLILELPGFGVIAEDALDRFVETLGLESMGIIGNSLGVSIAVDYAIRHPGNVHRLVTIGGIAGRLPEVADQIQAPTLLTWGRDDRVTPLDMALAPVRSIPNAELHVFPNSGHWAMIDQKDAFESVVLSFLLRSDPGRDGLEIRYGPVN